MIGNALYKLTVHSVFQLGQTQKQIQRKCGKHLYAALMAAKMRQASLCRDHS